MLRTFTAVSMLALACAIPLHEAAAQDPIAGGILGGVAGGLLGGAVGGRWRGGGGAGRSAGAAGQGPARSSAAPRVQPSPRRASLARTATTGTIMAAIP